MQNIRPRLPQLRFIVVTSSDDRNAVHEAAAAHAHGFLFLRDSVETLHKAVTAVLQGQSYFCTESQEMLLQRDERSSAVALTMHERAILRNIADGLGVKEIAERDGLSSTTIRKELAALKEKLGVRETAELVRQAVKIGLVDSVPPRPDALWPTTSSAG
jgi:DNA-binding NarL/FixJ family response regulator